MRTQRTGSHERVVPWLEYFHDREGRTLTFQLCQFPFTIGRDPAADLPVDSNRVSRRHAEIIHTPDGRYVLHDLKSTNGTSVNGMLVTETELQDGDIIVVADAELTFFGGGASSRIAVTQVMPSQLPTSPRETLDLIVGIRRLQEGLVHRTANSHFQPIVDLATKDVFGYELVRSLNESDSLSLLQTTLEQIGNAECKLLDRINQQCRLVAVELAMQWETPLHLFFPLQVADVSFDSLPDELSRLHELMNGRHQLVVEIPETAVCDVPYFRQFIERVREHLVKVAYTSFCSSAAQIDNWDKLAPDFLELAPALVHGVSRASGGCHKTQLLLDSAHDLGCAVIANGIQDATDADCLLELGCQYGRGSRYGEAEPISAWKDAQVESIHST